MRTELNPFLPAGHFHISRTQNTGEDLDPNKIKEELQIVKNSLFEGFKKIQ